MSEKKICEIAQMIQNKDVLENDLTDAMNMVTGLFQERYINRLDRAFKSCHGNYANNPSKEVRLIQSLKPFMDEQNQGSLDKLADMLIMMQTFQGIQKEALSHSDIPVSAASVDLGPAACSVSEETAIHEDGIYEVDKNCMTCKNGGISTANTTKNSNVMISVLLAACLVK